MLCQPRTAAWGRRDIVEPAHVGKRQGFRQLVGVHRLCERDDARLNTVAERTVAERTSSICFVLLLLYSYTLEGTDNKCNPQAKQQATTACDDVRVVLYYIQIYGSEPIMPVV